MCDDIDIEEHDVLENPSLKKIFPDLSVIKQEISRYYDEEQLDTNYQHFQTSGEVNHHIENTTDNKLNLESVENTSGIDVKPTNLLISDANQTKNGFSKGSDCPLLKSLLFITTNDEEKYFPHTINNIKYLQKKSPVARKHTQKIKTIHEIQKEIFSNELTNDKPEISQDNFIIVGSKPGQNTKELKSKQTRRYNEVKIELKDISKSLKACKRYCSNCLIVFPTVKAFESHADQHHSPNVNKNIDCKICGITMLKCNYKRHVDRFHNNEPTCTKPHKENLKHTISEGHECFHCEKMFPTQKDLIDHLYSVLEPNKGPEKNSVLNKLALGNVSDPKEIISLSTDIEDHNKKNDTENIIINTKNNIEKNVKNNQVAIKRNRPIKHNVPRNKIKKKNSYSSDDDFGNSLMLKKYKCKICLEKFVSQRNLDHHIELHHKEEAPPKLDESITNTTKQQLPDQVYFCSICSWYIKSLKNYSEHMLCRHNIEIKTQIQKVAFDPKCKLCSSNLSSVRSYNAHMQKYHKKQSTIEKEPCLLPESSKDKPKSSSGYSFACKSVLFKCMKCDIFFLSANEAMSHLEHIEILVNWKCLTCQRIFKKKDMKLHLKQHTTTKKFTIYTLSECELGRVLYKCLNCGVHFNERDYLDHHKRCDSEIPNSLYCNICDILISKSNMRKHDTKHKESKSQPYEFTIIESDILSGVSCKNEINKKKYTRAINVLNKSLPGISTDRDLLRYYVFSFCTTCKCFATPLGLSRRIHVEQKCGNVQRVICKDCGLVLTPNGYKTHQLIHKSRNNLNLQSLTFYDLNSKKPICPPIPEYPKCDNCDIHFLRIAAVKQHECHKQEYKKCHICQIKFTERAYNLHMPYHKYIIPKDGHVLEDNINNIDGSSNSEAHISNKDNSSVVPDATLYKCESCGLTVNTYEKVVLHCQDHYDPRIRQICALKCKLCTLQLDPDIIEAHKSSHSKSNYNSNSFKLIKYDPFYFRYDNNFWKSHIFSYVSDEEIKNILDSSIYQFECRLKMEVSQPGPPDLIVYKCEKCQVIVDPSSIYKHAENVCVKIKKYSCSFCALAFDSEQYQEMHERLHAKCNNLSSELLQIIIFNKKVHSIYHKSMFDACKKFILYQCRNCDGVVDKFHRDDHICGISKLKTCSNCGLLVYEQDFDLHFIRHEELDAFKTHNICILLYGKKYIKENNKLRPSFTGSVHDFTFYKCKRCELSFRSKKNVSVHVCIFTAEKCLCSKCNIYFLKQELAEHLNLHKAILELDKYSTNIIQFNPSNTDSSTEQRDISCREIEIKTKQSQGQNKTKISKATEIMLFKCDCGLHFLEKPNAEQHAKICNPKMKISRQICFKCNLLFTPGELFNHVLKHQCDQKSHPNFCVANVSKKSKLVEDK